MSAEEYQYIVHCDVLQYIYNNLDSNILDLVCYKYVAIPLWNNENFFSQFEILHQQLLNVKVGEIHITLYTYCTCIGSKQWSRKWWWWWWWCWRQKQWNSGEFKCKNPVWDFLEMVKECQRWKERLFVNNAREWCHISAILQYIAICLRI